MPTSSIDLYHMQDARNNFDAMRPAPICADANQFMDQCRNVHISTNCYYGYQNRENVESSNVATDCEMMEVADANGAASAPPANNARKRSADDCDTPLTKRFREDDSSICSLVGTRSSPSHSASALNISWRQCQPISKGGPRPIMRFETNWAEGNTPTQFPRHVGRVHALEMSVETTVKTGE